MQKRLFRKIKNHRIVKELSFDEKTARDFGWELMEDTKPKRAKKVKK